MKTTGCHAPVTSSTGRGGEATGPKKGSCFRHGYTHTHHTVLNSSCFFLVQRAGPQVGRGHLVLQKLRGPDRDQEGLGLVKVAPRRVRRCVRAVAEVRVCVCLVFCSSSRPCTHFENVLCWGDTLQTNTAYFGWIANFLRPFGHWGLFVSGSWLLWETKHGIPGVFLHRNTNFRPFS